MPNAANTLPAKGVTCSSGMLASTTQIPEPLSCINSSANLGGSPAEATTVSSAGGAKSVLTGAAGLTGSEGVSLTISSATSG